MNFKKDNEKESAIIIRNVPKSVRRALKIKAATEDKSMQGIILDLIIKYTRSEEK